MPVFLACQWTDEQTGGHCPALVEQFTGKRERKWFTFTNGAHIDSLDPATFNRWFDFLELYVAQREAAADAGDQGELAPVLYSAFMGVPGVQLPDDPIQQQPDYASALAAFEALPHVRVLFDNGAGGADPGEPLPALRALVRRVPGPGRRRRSRWYLARDGTLAGRAGWRRRRPVHLGSRGAAAADRLHRQHRLGGRTASGPPRRRYDWTQSPGGTALSYVSAPLAEDTGVLGAGAVAALGALVGQERRPAGDGLRGAPRRQRDLRAERLAADRARASSTAERSTLLEPVPSFRKRDATTLPKGKWVEGDGPALLPGPHLSPGLAHAGDDLGARRRPADLGVRRGAAAGPTPWVAVAHSKKQPSRLVFRWFRG